MDVVRNEQLGSVQLCFVLVTVNTGRDLDPIAKASRGWSARARRRIFRMDSLKNDARLAVMMMVPAFTLDTNDVVADAGDVTNANMIVNGSLEGASNGSGRSEDSGFVCWYW